MDLKCVVKIIIDFDLIFKSDFNQNQRVAINIRRQVYYDDCDLVMEKITPCNSTIISKIDILLREKYNEPATCLWNSGSPNFFIHTKSSYIEW